MCTTSTNIAIATIGTPTYIRMVSIVASSNMEDGAGDGCDDVGCDAVVGGGDDVGGDDVVGARVAPVSTHLLSPLQTRKPSHPSSLVQLPSL